MRELDLYNMPGILADQCLKMVVEEYAAKIDTLGLVSSSGLSEWSELLSRENGRWFNSWLSARVPQRDRGRFHHHYILSKYKMSIYRLRSPFLAHYFTYRREDISPGEFPGKGTAAILE